MHKEMHMRSNTEKRCQQRLQQHRRPVQPRQGLCRPEREERHTIKHIDRMGRALRTSDMRAFAGLCDPARGSADEVRSLGVAIDGSGWPPYCAPPLELRRAQERWRCRARLMGGKRLVMERIIMGIVFMVCALAVRGAKYAAIAPGDLRHTGGAFGFRIGTGFAASVPAHERQLNIIAVLMHLHLRHDAQHDMSSMTCSVRSNIRSIYINEVSLPLPNKVSQPSSRTIRIIMTIAWTDTTSALVSSHCARLPISQRDLLSPPIQLRNGVALAAHEFTQYDNAIDVGCAGGNINGGIFITCMAMTAGPLRPAIHFISRNFARSWARRAWICTIFHFLAPSLDPKPTVAPSTRSGGLDRHVEMRFRGQSVRRRHDLSFEPA